MATPNHDAYQRVAELYRQSCTELLAAYSLGDCLTPTDIRRQDRKQASYVSVLGLTGDGVRLVSTLDLDLGLLRATYPAGGSEPSTADLEDWCRELNNQIAGRLKNKLLPLGCRVMLGLPSLLTGVDITAVDHDELDTHRLYFTSPDGDFALTLASHIAESVVFAEEAAAVAQPEGGILFEGGFQLF